MLYLREMAFEPRSWGLVLRNMLVAVMLVVFSMFSNNPNLPKSAAYKLVRQVVRLQTDIKTRNWMQLSGDHFYLRYKAQDALVAQMVLDTAEKAFGPANGILGAVPDDKIPIILYPDKGALNRSFGWDADQSAMGVYWAGVIRILSPTEWVRGETYQEREEYFVSNGPMAHEYTHMIVDYKTGGNYPRWLTEGIAQYVERELTGFQFKVPAINSPEELYSIAQMDGQFDLLSSQSVAYWQSLAMVEDMVDLKGMDGVQHLLARLGEGRTFANTFKETYGMTLEGFQNRFTHSFK
ncbi:hypothetical protein MFMK1_000498 [Metallumcola ferriviriculae]|uniref:Peptidase MA-like domain-containing protein n=1 Tax=Metallumcola ferriviriculae TaxID=3039180 RepID=A0AAU0UIU1_9FIRM|nr:hypothetical protein MFMK1_000498 [Desulfitibacteraceae bacterium MK1]